ncbi:hypothetical protein L1987_29506 [Smallanthus sonchifolius]|uniref:Uncharacterized protein n=1 Tax=Smallanthus sonchifolius TaxID=185202 RepID=A0ACB9I1R4_9ASTR|nr:hypothetical protein L1987_29506 [Smallanthus sonchifolius]
MGDDTPQNVMNLDLNLGPVETEPGGLNLEDWLEEPVGDSFGPTRTMTRRRRWRSMWRPVLFPTDGMSGLETGEGSVAAVDGRPPAELTKTCDNSNRYQENDCVGEKEHVVKSNENEGGFFDCNICFDMASDPVVTYCGHLFCWPCLYRWLHIHSDVKECPICKGEMTTKTVTPIYGRGNPTRVVEEDSDLKIPSRPQAKRVESFRQTIQRNVFTMPMEEMIRRLGSRFDLTRDLVQGQGLSHSFLAENPREISERNNSLLNRFLASRRLRIDQDQSHNNPTLVEPFHNHQEQTPSMEDRDSVSSIAAVIQSESQTVDTAAEIDSRVSLSTSSSRRRSESSRVSDVDSGDSRASRRRRLF